MNYVITGKSFTSNLFSELQEKGLITVLSEAELVASDIRFTTEDKLYVPFEGSLDTVYERMDDTDWTKKVTTMRDKFAFRELLSGMFPDFYYKKISINEIADIEVPKGKRLVLKPIRGFMATAVKIIDEHDDLLRIQEELSQEVRERSAFFSSSVVSTDEILIEECIEGEEYAVDSYVNDDGELVILNITAHPCHEKFHYMQALYHTNYEQFMYVYEDAKSILERYHELVGTKNIPIHAEFILREGKLVPVEFNTPRFGGMGYADLTYHFFGINPFEAFFTGRKVTPEDLWTGKEDAYFGWVLAYNGKDLDMRSYKPLCDKIKAKFTNVLAMNILDYKTSPAFAIMYVKEKSLDKILQVLHFEFKDYFVNA